MSKAVASSTASGRWAHRKTMSEPRHKSASHSSLRAREAIPPYAFKERNSTGLVKDKEIDPPPHPVIDSRNDEDGIPSGDFTFDKRPYRYICRARTRSCRRRESLGSTTGRHRDTSLSDKSAGTDVDG